MKNEKNNSVKPRFSITPLQLRIGIFKKTVFDNYTIFYPHLDFLPLIHAFAGICVYALGSEYKPIFSLSYQSFYAFIFISLQKKTAMN